MQKILFALFILILAFASCTPQMTDEEIPQRAEEIKAAQATETSESTESPTPTETPTSPEPSQDMGIYDYERYNTEPFESYYACLEDNERITDEYWEKLRYLYDVYDVVVYFDASHFGLGVFDDNDIPLYEGIQDDMIRIIYNNLTYFGDDEETVNIIKKSLGNVSYVDYFGYAGMNGVIDNVPEMIISGAEGELNDLKNRPAQEVTYTNFSELSDLIFDKYDLSLDKFVSLNQGFSEYDEGKSVEDTYLTYLRDNFEGIEKTYELYKSGVIHWDGLDTPKDDMNFYFKGLFLNEEIDGNTFWRVVQWSYYEDPDQIVYKKTQEIIRQLNSINSKWTPEFFYKYHCKNEIPGGLLDGYYD